MSINVTVSGNPVYVKKGAMVTSDDSTKIEFDKRRLIRLEQVRQQSKDIAANIRGKLKKDKAKKESDTKNEGEITLKKWQARKLLELQDQYQDALSEMGMGHKQADQAQMEDEMFVEKQEINDRAAKDRGRVAAHQMQAEKNQQNISKATPIQRKKLVRDMENRRASLISRDKTPNKKKKVEHMAEPVDYDSERENRIPQFNLDSNRSSLPFSSSERPPSPIFKQSKEQQTGQTFRKETTSEKEAQTSVQTQSACHEQQFQYDTRISERIHQRLYPEPQNFTCFHRSNCNCCTCIPLVKPCNVHETHVEKPQKVEEKGVQVVLDQSNDKGIQTSFAERSCIPDDLWPEFQESSLQDDSNKSRKHPNEKRIKSNIGRQIPHKPKVTLTSKDASRATTQTDKTQNYDQSSRYTKQQIPTKPYVEKIDEDSIEMTPLTEEDLREKMRRKDIEAYKRGQAAMEKQRIEKEYQELMKKLPALQKQERIAEIGMDKERYHMSDSRAEEREKYKQNRLDNAYEDAFIRPNPITLPRINFPTNRAHEQSVWDGDFIGEERSSRLSAMLSQLKAQKKDLLHEIKSVMSQETLAQLAHLLKSSSSGTSTSEDKPPVNVTKRKRDAAIQSTAISEDGSEKSRRRSSPSPRKRAKKKVLVLQNTSTQTTPKPAQSAATSPIAALAKDAATGGDCMCKDDVCEIVIKIQDDDQPKVTVNPPLPGRTIKVIKEDSKNETIKSARESTKSRDSKDQSWKQNLSHAQSNSTSSTSYIDPPNSYKWQSDSKPGSKAHSTTKRSFNSTTSSSGSRQLDPRLLTYIQKLLLMSRASIEDLTVSGVSEVSTPSQSVIDIPSNNPLHQVENIIRYFNLDRADLQNQLRSFSTSANGSTLSTPGESGPKTCAENKCDTGKVMCKYADMADSCTRKISDLTAKIEKVREEKRRIIESSSVTSDSEKDSSTKYLDLPKDSSYSGEDEIDKRLLEIDYNYAEQLKRITVDQEQEKKTTEVETYSDDELMERLKKLLERPQLPSPPKEEFTPILDIPKLPKLDESAKSRPPPSKGLRNLNPQVALIPHELSTIAEADSLVSTKLDSPSKSPAIKSKELQIIQQKSSSSSDDVETMEAMLNSIGMEWAIPTLRKTREALALSSSESKSGSPSMLSDSQEVSLMQVDSRRTSTPVQGNKHKIKETSQIFSTSSNISSVKDMSQSQIHSQYSYSHSDNGSDNKINLSRTHEKSEVKFESLCDDDPSKST